MILGSRFDDAFLFLAPAYYPIGVGAWLGTIMLINVWALIWPNQKKILGIKPATDAEKAKARRIAFLAFFAHQHHAFDSHDFLHGRERRGVPHCNVRLSQPGELPTGSAGTFTGSPFTCAFFKAVTASSCKRFTIAGRVFAGAEQAVHDLKQ